MPLETEATAEIRALVADLKPDDADLLEALHRVQHRYGFISREAMQVIGEQLRMQPAQVYGTTTYYSDFRITPPPAVTVAWCSGPACQVRNGMSIRNIFEAVFGIQLGEDTPDGRLGLAEGQCNGSCEQAPQVWVEGRVVGRLTAARTVELARALRGGATPEELFGAPASGGAHV